MCVDFFMKPQVKADCQQDQSESLNYFLLVNFYELGRPPVDNLQAVTFQRYPLHPSAECTAFSEFIASGFLFTLHDPPGAVRRLTLPGAVFFRSCRALVFCHLINLRPARSLDDMPILNVIGDLNQWYFIG